MLPEPHIAAFVGRARELAILAAQLSRGGVVVVRGEAGVGKTTLVDQFLRRLDGTPVVRGYCPAEPAPPLWPWRAAMRRVGIGIEPGPALEATAAASARFAALAGMSDTLLSGGASVIVLEDLHWSDTASLDLLRHVAAAATGSAVTVVATVRTPADEDVEVRLAALGRYGAEAVTLTPFTPDEVAAVVGADSADEVFARTGGLPLLVAAVRGGGSTDLAGVVRGLLAVLTAPQRGVIEAAAVLGEHVDEQILTAVTEDGVEDALSAARRGGLLTESADGRGYRFTHALIRDEIARRLDPAARRHLNRSAAMRLESAGDDDRAALVARLWRAAGSDPDARLAASRWGRRAAVAAHAAHAHDDAVRYLTDALADVSAAPDGERAAVLLELATAEYLAGHYDRCLDRSLDAADAAAAAGRGDLVAHGALVLQGVTFPRAAEVLSRLCRRALAFELSPSLRARVLAQLAVVEADAGRVDHAEPLAKESLALAELSRDPQAQIDAARAREMTLVHPVDDAERAGLGDLVADRAELLGQPVAAIIGHGWRIRAAYQNARLDIVESATEAMTRLATRSRLPLAQWHLHRLMASRSVLVGRFAESVEHSRRATVIARASGDATAAAMHFAHGIHLALLRGDPTDLPEGYREALAAAPSMMLIDVERANVSAVTGHEAEARAIYDRVGELLPIPELHPAWPAVLTQLVGLVVRFEDAATARLVYRQLAPFRVYPGAFGSPTVYFTGSISRFLGELAAVFGEPLLAAELLREALVRNQAVNAWPDAALTSLDLARLQRTRGSLAEAGQLAQDALRVATRLDMPGTVAAAGALVAAVAVAVAAERDHADPLTVREREIAVLVAEAMTNRQIAARLVLSERTVESHVRSMLAKTGCANRTEFLARWSEFRR